MSVEQTESGWGSAMNAQEHLSTYESFISMSKIGIVAIVVILALMAFFLL